MGCCYSQPLNEENNKDQPEDRNSPLKSEGYESNSNYVTKGIETESQAVYVKDNTALNLNLSDCY